MTDDLPTPDARTVVDPALRPTLPESARTSTPVHGLEHRYADIEEINRGGMGAILRAHDPTTGRDVAIKVLQQATPDADQLARFLDEGRITAQLEHPAIVPIHEVGRTTAGHPYIAMKLVRGRSLAELQDGGEIDLAGALEALVRVCEAVSFAHARGVIHRDLKPDNVMIGEFGEVLVMDWGLARLAAGRDGAPRADAASTVAPTGAVEQTLDGAIVGTPAYMSPEQALGEHHRVGPATDIYALGAMLYFALTGCPPVAGKTVLAVIDDVAQGRIVPPSQRDPDVPRELEAVALKALAFDPADRYADPAALRADLLAYGSGHRLTAAEYTPWQLLAKWIARHRGLAAAVGLVGLILVGGVSFELLRAHQRRAEARARLEASMAELPLLDDVQALLRARLTSGAFDDPAPPPHHRDDMQAAMTAVAEADRALHIVGSTRTLLSKRIEAGRLLVMLALLGNDRTTARIAIAQMQPHLMAVEREAAGKTMTGWVDRDAARRRTARLARVGEICDELEANPIGRTNRVGRYRFEISTWVADEAISRAIAARLARITPGTVTDGQRAVIEFGASVLAMIGPRHAPDLAELLVQLHDDLRARRVLYEALIAIGEGDAVRGALSRDIRAIMRDDPVLADRIVHARRDLGLALGTNTGSKTADRVAGLLRRGELIQAERALEALTREQPDAYMTHNLLGILRIKQGRLREGLAALDRSVALGNTASETQYFRSMALLYLGRPRDAELAARRALAGNPNPEQVTIIVRALIAQGKRDAALALVAQHRSWLRKRLDRLEPLLMLAEMYRALRFDDEALATYRRAIEVAPRSHLPYARVAVMLAETGRAAEALARIDEALARYRGSKPVELQATRADCLRRLDRPDEALRTLDRARVDVGSRYQVELTRALIYLDRWRPGDAIPATEALKAAERAAESRAERAHIWFVRALIAAKRDDATARASALDRALEHAPHHAEALRLRAILRIQGKRWDEALSDINRALAQDDRNAAAHETRGNVLQMLGRLDDAREAYVRSIRIDPTRWRTHVNLAIVQANQGRFEEALAGLVKARSRAPQAKRAAIDARIAVLRKKLGK